MSDIRKMSIAELADWESYCDDSDAGPYIAELASRLEAAEADRDRWKAEAMAARDLLSDYMIDAQSWHGDYPNARAANGEVPHD